MKRNRFKLSYLVFTLLVMLIGIASRKTSQIPLFIGDVLYAVMIYFGMRFLFIQLKIFKTFLLAFFFCFSIEIFQLVQLNWLIAIRKTHLGHYILGEGFLWSDLVCYAIGVFIGYNIDKKIISFLSYPSKR